jgi:hypothetical protein
MKALWGSEPIAPYRGPSQATFDGSGTKIEAMGLHQGTTNSLRAKVNAAAGHFAAGDLVEAIGTLSAFLNEVAAQTGKI